MMTVVQTLAIDVTPEVMWSFVRTRFDMTVAPTVLETSVIACGSARHPRELLAVITEISHDLTIDSIAHPVMPKRGSDGTNLIHPMMPSSPRDEHGYEVASLIVGCIHAEAVHLGAPIDAISVGDVQAAVGSSLMTDAAKSYIAGYTAKEHGQWAFISLIGMLAGRRRLASFLASLT